MQAPPIAWNIIVGTLFSRISTSMSIPFLSIYLTQVKHVSPVTTGFIVGTSSLLGIFASFNGGYLSDLMGRKALLLTSIFCWCLVFLGFFFATHILSFFILNALNGLCQSTFEPSSKALLSDITKKEDRLKLFNLRYTAINIGVVFGPLLGLQLGSAKSTFPFLLASITYLLYGLSLVYFFRAINSEQSHQNENKLTFITALNTTRKDTLFLVTLVGMIFSISGYAQFSSTLPQFFAERSQSGSGLFAILLSLNAIIAISVQYPILKIMKNKHPLNSLIVGNVFISFSLLAISFTSNIILLGIIVLFFTIGEVLIFSMIDIIVDYIAKPDLKGTYFGAIGFNRLGNVIGPWLGGILLGLFSHNSFYVFLIIFLTTLLGVPALIIAKSKMKIESKTNKVKIN